MHDHYKPQACVIIICGLPATGKTSLAMALAQIMGLEYFGTDMLREKMGLKGKYDTESKKAVYNKMLKDSTTSLKQHTSVVIDGTFHKKEQRKPFIDLAETYNARITWVELQADEPAISRRMKKVRLFSEADLEIYRKIKTEMDPYPEGCIQLQSDTSTLEEMINVVIKQIPDDCQGYPSAH
jgi:predicted kinase